MSSKGEKQRASRIRITVLAILILTAMGGTYYAQSIPDGAVWYRHFCYLPIVVAGLWWGMRGLSVAALLSGWLIASHILLGVHVPIMHDLLRAGMYIVVGTVAGVIREQELKTRWKLQKSEAQLRGVLNASDEIIFTKDLNGCYTLANAAFSERFNRPLKEILGKMDEELFPEEEGETLRAIDRKVLEKGETDTREDVLTVGEEEFIFKTTKVPIRDERGKIVGLCGFANDITERKRAEKTSRESEARFRAVVETAIDAIIIIDGNDKIIFWNRAAADIFGYSAGETIGKPLTLIMPERFREAHQKAITRVISSRKLHVTAKPVEMVGLRKDGREFPVEFSLAAWETGKERFFTAILRDITERKRAEELLRESEARYRLLFKKLADAVFITSFEGEILEANPAASEQTGYSHEELIGMNIMEDLADEEPAATYEKAKGRLARGETVYFEEKKHRKDGTIYYTGCAVTQIEYKGKPATLSVNRDITERVQAEEALHWERDLASALEEATAALTATLDFEEVLDLILEEVTRVVPNDATNIMLSEGDKARIARWRGYERFGVEKFVSKVVFRIPEVGNLKQMRESMEPVVISDTTTYPGWLDVPGQEWLRSYAAVPIIVRGEVIGFLNVDSATPGFFTQAHAEILRSFAHRAAAAIENARLYEKVRQELTQREQAREELRLSFIQLAETVSRAMESHDPYTAGHQRRVAELARAIGEEMGFDQERLLGLYITGLLHDIGKLSIPAEMLTYPGRPTEEEWGIICSHPRRGYEILREAKFPWPVADIVLQHHERLDGSGYPKGLKDDEILLEARILAVADVVEAMSSHRPYREALGNEKALAEIEKNKGHLYDVDVADACLRLFRERRFKFSKQQM